METQNKIKNNQNNFNVDTQKFANIPKEERSDFNKRILKISQIMTKPPFEYIKAFPSTGKFLYQGFNLHYYYIQQSKKPKGILIQVHGLNGHSESSGYFSNIIAQHNKQFNIYAFDQLNFGRSEGPYRGEIASFEDSMNQVEEFTNFILKQFDNSPKVFLSGWSYGGAIIFKLGILHPQKYAGMILLAPALRNLAEDQFLMKKLGKFLGCLCPRIRTFEIDFSTQNRYDQSQKLKKDAYTYQDGFVPGSIRVVLNAMDEVSMLYSKFTLPYILFQAGVDKLVDLFAPLDLQAQSPSKDKSTIYYENMWHVVLQQEEIDDIAVKSSEWIKQRL